MLKTMNYCTAEEQTERHVSLLLAVISEELSSTLLIWLDQSVQNEQMRKEKDSKKVLVVLLANKL